MFSMLYISFNHRLKPFTFRVRFRVHLPVCFLVAFPVSSPILSPVCKSVFQAAPFFLVWLVYKIVKVLDFDFSAAVEFKYTPAAVLVSRFPPRGGLRGWQAGVVGLPLTTY